MTVPGPADFTGAVTRCTAFVVDAVLLVLAAGTAALGVELIGLLFAVAPHDRHGAAIRVLVIALPTLLICYDVTFWTLAGRTPGMALLGVRVVGTNGRPVSWARFLLRALVLAVFPIGAAWCVVDRRRQAVHDKVARTVVVRNARAALTPPG
jgi:uncharacterized RDD family membrane protein YckC